MVEKKQIYGIETMKQISKDRLCIRCLGCNKLELEDFNGTYRCEYFIQAEGDTNVDKQRSKNEIN